MTTVIPAVGTSLSITPDASGSTGKHGIGRVMPVEIEMKQLVPPTKGYTKYGQIACQTCGIEPPLGLTGLCSGCTVGKVIVPFVEPDDATVSPDAPQDVPSVKVDPAPVKVPRQSTKGLSEDEKRAKRIARSKAWHLAKKQGQS